MSQRLLPEDLPSEDRLRAAQRMETGGACDGYESQPRRGDARNGDTPDQSRRMF